MGLFRNLKLGQKLLLGILSTTFFIYLASFGYVATNMRSQILHDTEQIVYGMAREYASEVEKELNHDFDLTIGMGHAFSHFHAFEHSQMDPIYNPMLREFLYHNDNFFSTWVSWELNAILDDYFLPYGRARHTYLRTNGDIFYQTDTLELDGDNTQGLYYQIKTDKQIVVTDPYWFSYTGDESDQVLEISICYPLLHHGHFSGLVGTDIVLDRFQGLISSLVPFGLGHTFLLSTNGTFVGHPDSTLLGQNIFEDRYEYAQHFELEEQMAQTEIFSHEYYDERIGEQAYFVYAPIHIGNMEDVWYFAVVIPRSFIFSQANTLFVRTLFIAFLGLVILSVIVYVIARRISLLLGLTTSAIHNIAKGKTDDTNHLSIDSGDELGEMSAALTKLQTSLKDKALFAARIGEGKLDEEFEVLGNDDILGDALLNMRKSLQIAKKDEAKRQAEDFKRNWTTQGLAKFSDILREDTEDIYELTFNVLRNMIKYLDVNQGGIFILNDDDKNDAFLELTSCYAFDRKKYIEKRIEIGEGLVGACFLEKKTTYMADVPQDYINITSGLGGERPSYIVLVPLLLNDVVYGVIEIASFKALETYQVDFIEKIGENIASSVSSAKINQQTSYLLEQSQQQAEEMRAQEEEMRQNMEEMQATQEEMTRKEKDLKYNNDTMDKLCAIMEYDAKGIILRVNENFCKASGFPQADLLGKHHSVLFDKDNAKTSANYQKFWMDLKKGNSVKSVLKRRGKNGKYFIVKGISSPVLDENNTLVKVLEITIDISNETRV